MNLLASGHKSLYCTEVLAKVQASITKKKIILSHLIEALHDHNIGVYGASSDGDFSILKYIRANFIASNIYRFKPAKKVIDIRSLCKYCNGLLSFLILLIY